MCRRHANANAALRLQIMCLIRSMSRRFSLYENRLKAKRHKLLSSEVPLGGCS
jgi:hypothetical protein